MFAAKPKKRFEPSRRDIMEAVDGESAVRGLLVTLLNLFNVDSGSTLSRLEFTAGAAALGYDISDEKWAGLYKRFAMANAPDDEDYEVEELDLSLLGERFRAMYDPLLEALLRQTLRGLIFQSARISKLEESLDSVMNAGERDRNSKMQRVMNRFRNGLLTTTLDAWKSMVAQTRELKGRVARMWSNRLLAAVWQQWQEATAEGRGRRQKLANAVGILKNRQIAMAFACWVELLDDARRRWAAAERAIARMRNALVAGCWVSWVEAVIRSKEQREALGRVAARLQNRAMAQAFDGWTGMVAEVKWQREAVSSVLGRLRNRELAAAFDAWHEAASGAASAREEALRRAGAMLTNRTLLLAFEAWREAVASKHALLDRARQLAGRWLHALCGRCFDAWAEAAERQRRIFRQAAHAIGPGRLLWLAYSTWKASVKEAVAERERERMQSEITSSVASGLGGKLSGQHAELAAQLEAQLSRQLEQQLAAQLAAQLDERLEVRMQHSLPEGLAAQLDERVTSQLASLHSVVVTEGSSHREAMEAIKRKVDHLHIHLPSQLERKVSDDVAHEVAEAMRRAAQEVARQEKALEEVAEIRRQEEEKQRQAKLVKERQRREEGLRRRVANRLANRGLSTCFYAWADDVRQQVQARAAKRVRDEAEEGARRQIETERESLQEEFLARLRAAGAAWFDEMIDSSELMQGGPKGLIRRVYDAAGMPYVDEHGQEVTYEDEKEKVMTGVDREEFLRTSRVSVVHPIGDRRSLTVLDLLDERYMAPGGQLAAQHLEAEFRRLQQEVHSLRFALVGHVKDALADMDLLSAYKTVASGAMRPLSTSPRFSMPPGSRLPSTAWQEMVVATTEDLVSGRLTPARQVVRPGSAKSRRLQATRSAAALMGYDGTAPAAAPTSDPAASTE